MADNDTLSRQAPVIIVTGPPGVGKSTVSAALADTFDRSALVSGDQFFSTLRSGFVEPWLPQSHQQNVDVMDITLDTAAAYAERGWTTVLDGIVGPWFLDVVRHRLRPLQVHYAVLMASLDTCRSRFVDRDGGTGETATKMHHEFTSSGVEARHIVEAAAGPEATLKLLTTAIGDGRLLLDTGEVRAV